MGVGMNEGAEAEVVNDPLCPRCKVKLRQCNRRGTSKRYHSYCEECRVLVRASYTSRRASMQYLHALADQWRPKSK